MRNTLKLITLSLTLTLILVVVMITRMYFSSIPGDLNKPLVIMYETDLDHANLNVLKKSLLKNGYQYKILTDKKWIAFGKKIQRIHEYVKQLPGDKLIIVCDARDVISVNHDSDLFIRKFKELVDSESRVLVSTEIGCCVRTAFGPGQYRTNTGDVIHRSFDDKTAEQSFETQWKNMFKSRADKKMIKHTVEHKQSIYLNAGIYAGKVKNIDQMYTYMAIHEKEDDQVIMSEIFYHHPNMFHLDYNREFFSNSHVWDTHNKGNAKNDTGCYYKITKDNKIIDTYLNSTPFFIHTPGKHFNCFDHLQKIK